MIDFMLFWGFAFRQTDKRTDGWTFVLLDMADRLDDKLDGRLACWLIGLLLIGSMVDRLYGPLRRFTYHVLEQNFWMSILLDVGI